MKGAGAIQREELIFSPEDYSSNAEGRSVIYFPKATHRLVFYKNSDKTLFEVCRIPASIKIKSSGAVIYLSNKRTSTINAIFSRKSLPCVIVSEKFLTEHNMLIAG